MQIDVSVVSGDGGEFCILYFVFLYVKPFHQAEQ